jgi:ABC-type branched-subunit amino acid transport system ATPase component
MNPILKVQNLTKHFGGVYAVDKLHFEVKGNSITGLIGPNGAGKTTAFNLITHFLPRQTGTIHFKNKDLGKKRTQTLVKNGMARTFQQIRLWPNLTVRENLLLACSHRYDAWWKSFLIHKESELEAQAKALLAKVNLEKYWDHLASELSYGQSKLVEIVRTILTDADLILLDEPAAGINPTLLKTIESLIFELKAQGKTLLVIEHNMPFLMRISDEIVVMENGKFLVQDVPEKVQKDPKVLEAYLGGRI